MQCTQGEQSFGVQPGACFKMTTLCSHLRKVQHYKNIQKSFGILSLQDPPAGKRQSQDWLNSCNPSWIGAKCWLPLKPSQVTLIHNQQSLLTTKQGKGLEVLL